jgi:hypothetical protein
MEGRRVQGLARRSREQDGSGKCEWAAPTPIYTLNLQDIHASGRCHVVQNKKHLLLNTFAAATPQVGAHDKQRTTGPIWRVADVERRDFQPVFDSKVAHRISPGLVYM